MVDGEIMNSAKRITILWTFNEDRQEGTSCRYEDKWHDDVEQNEPTSFSRDLKAFIFSDLIT